MVTTFPTLIDDNQDERRAKIISWISTAAFAILLFLILFLIKIITPIPAIPQDPETISLEIGLNMGTGGDSEVQGGGSQGNTGMPGMQNPSDAASAPPTNPTDNGAVTDNNSDNPSAPNSNHTGQAKQPSAEMLAAMANFNKNKGKASITMNSGGQGDGAYTGGMGDGDGSDLGPKKGGDVGPEGNGGQGGTNPIGNGNRIRSILSTPQIVNPTQEEGKVVVNVYVNREGKVIKTERSSSGSTTFNPTLIATATQSAYKIKFNPDPQGPEVLLLAIDIVFTLK